VQQLEEDYKSVAAARDQLRKKLADAEEQRAKLKQEVEKLLLVAKEAEETKQQLTLRTPSATRQGPVRAAPQGHPQLAWTSRSGDSNARAARDLDHGNARAEQIY